jgi:hypothetical protein
METAGWGWEAEIGLDKDQCSLPRLTRIVED